MCLTKELSHMRVVVWGGLPCNSVYDVCVCVVVLVSVSVSVCACVFAHVCVGLVEDGRVGGGGRASWCSCW